MPKISCSKCSKTFFNDAMLGMHMTSSHPKILSELKSLEEWVENRKNTAYARDPDFKLSLDRIAYFLSLGNISQEHMDFALVWHASHGCIDICSVLLDAGANISCTVEALNNSSPLRSATIHGEEIARYLLTRGASIHTPGIVKTAGLYGHISLVKLLVLAGADFETDIDGESLIDAIRTRCDSPNRDEILHFLEQEAKGLARLQTRKGVETESSMEALPSVNSAALSKVFHDIEVYDATHSSNVGSGTDAAAWRSDGKVEQSNHIRIMMSYCWDNQETIKNITAQLRASGPFQVWIDVDHMCGSTLDSMARAVEEADIVLMGVSSGYKASTNCRLEAEYAAIKMKNLIPLMLQKNYRPDGWLGLLMGSNLWFDFSEYTSTHIFPQRPFENLLKEIFIRLGKSYSAFATGAYIPLSVLNTSTLSPTSVGSNHELCSIAASSDNAISSCGEWSSEYLIAKGVRLDVTKFGSDCIDKVSLSELLQLFPHHGSNSSANLDFMKFLVGYVVVDTKSALCLAALLRSYVQK